MMHMEKEARHLGWRLQSGRGQPFLKIRGDFILPGSA
jgi:hypothetical protein